jgi:hypothetical protein
MIRLLLPVAGTAAFFALSLTTVRGLRPRDPTMIADAVLYQSLWPIARTEDALGLACDLCLQLLACLTLWNAFYSVLWGFSGSLINDLFNEPALRDRERLVQSYAGDGELDRIMARRLPNLIRGGFVDRNGRTLRLCPKGAVLALGTLMSFKLFSLGMGGGVK